jgi:transposase
MMPENGSWRMNSEGESCHCGKLRLPFATAARIGAPQAVQVADRFHIMKNLVEAVEVELARYWPEVQQVRRGEQVSDGAIDRPLPSVEDWRPPPDPSSEKAQETRRAERLDSYQQ